MSLTDAFKHLIRYAEKRGGTMYWRFASHPRFPYWALDMKQRHQLITQSSVYLHQHPADAQLTIDDLRDMVGRLSAEQLMHRLQRYAAKVQGSSQYWYQRYQELRALIAPLHFSGLSVLLIIIGQNYTSSCLIVQTLKQLTVCVCMLSHTTLILQIVFLLQS